MSAKHYPQLLTLLLFVALGQDLLAQQVYQVTSTGDTGTGTLREAILQAEQDKKVDTIRFDGSLAGSTITLLDSIEILEDLVIDGAGAPGLVVSGGWDGNNASTNGTRLFFLPDDKDPKVWINNLHLTRGNAGPGDDDGLGSGENDALSNGGLIFFHRGELHLTDVVLSHGNAHDGGLIWQKSGEIFLTRCTVFGGRARDDGGVIHQANGKFLATNSTFYDNVAAHAGGATNSGTHFGSVARAYGELNFKHCTFAYNKAPGATLYNSGQLLISHNLFTANDSGAGYEDVSGFGDLKDYDGGSLTIEDGNYGDDPSPAFNVLTTSQIALGPLYDDGSGVLACQLDCASQLYGTISSTGTDQRLQARAVDSEPGALELFGCPDTDGDGQRDAIDLDDDSDEVYDVEELAPLRLDSSALLDHFAAGTHIGDAIVSTASTTISFDAPGFSQYRVEADVQGNPGILVGVVPASQLASRTATITFGEAVHNLQFSLTDFDAVRPEAHETVIVRAYAADGALINLTDNFVTLGSNVERIGNQISAIANLPSLDGTTNPDGNVNFGGFPRPVKVLELEFSSGRASGAPSLMYYYLSRIQFTSATAVDADADGKPAILDVDADGDGVPDFVEAQTSAAYSSAASNITPTDTDGDGAPDFLDEDSDDDGELDVIEAHDTNNDGIVDGLDSPVFGSGQANALDADNDGFDDGFDTSPVFGGGQQTSIGGMPESNSSNSDFNWRDDDANVAGTVWHDVNTDGIRQDTEAVFINTVVYLKDEVTDATLLVMQTDDDGKFLALDGGFNNPQGNALYVEVDPPGGFGNPSPADQGGNDRVDSDISNTYRTTPFTISNEAPMAYIGAGFSAGALPVQLIDNTWTVGEDCTLTAEWWVGDERQVAQYEVQFAGDGQEWSTLATIDASGQWAYAKTLLAQVGYYRLVAVDNDGSVAEWPATYVEPCGKTDEALQVAPNPIPTGAVLSVVGLRPNERVVLLDAIGRRLDVPVTQGSSPNTLHVSTAGLAPGVYVVQVSERSTRVVVR